MLIDDLADPQTQLELSEHIERLSDILDDLVALRGGVLPDELALRDAPRLENYSTVLTPSSALRGIASGHPILGAEPRFIVTSPLVALLPGHELARTMSRWYRIGPPASANSITHYQ